MTQIGKVKRRNVLKAAGGSTMGLSAIPAVTGVQNGTRYEGVAYDPATHEILGSASGQFSSVRNELVGTLEVAGKKIRLNQDRPNHRNTHHGVRQEQYKQIDRKEEKSAGRKVKILSPGKDTITGVIRTSDFNQIAFSLVRRPNGSQLSVQNAVEEFAPSDMEIFTGESEIGSQSDEDDYTAASSSCDVSDCDNSGYKQIEWSNVLTYKSELEGMYSHCSYLTAEADNDAHDYDEINAGGWNRWNLQSFFPERPSLDEDEYESCVGAGGTPCYTLVPSSARYYVDLTYDTGSRNDNAYIDQLNPGYNHDSGDEFNFGARISAGFGPVSAGWSISKNNNAKSPDAYRAHRYVEWDYPIDWLPTEQDNCNGVYFNVHAGGEYRQERFKVESSMSWMIMKLRSNGDRIGVLTHSEANEYKPTFDVVPDNR